MTYQIRGPLSCVECGSEKTIARKLCRPCYARMHALGKLDQYPILKPEDVFESRIDKTSHATQYKLGPCWIWRGGCNEYGYGIFLLPGEVPVRAHRYAYEFFTGKKIPPGKIIMHLCDNPPCVNPKHLRVGTKADNNRDTAVKRRHNYGLEHWNGRLTDQMVRDIKASTEPTRVLAIYYNVDMSHIYRIRHGQARK